MSSAAQLTLTPPPPPRPQAVFNLDLDHYSDDDALLDWEQYSVMRRVRCCGCDCTWLARRLPCWSPPDWWFSFTKRQRRCLATTAGVAATFLALVVLLVAARATGAWPGEALSRSGHQRGRCSGP